MEETNQEIKPRRKTYNLSRWQKLALITIPTIVLGALGELGARLRFPSYDTFLLKNRPISQTKITSESMRNQAMRIGGGFITDDKIQFKLDPEFQDEYIRNITTKGYRARATFPEEKEEGQLWISCVGDSSTAGWGIKDDKEIFPQILEEKLRGALPKGALVLNRGVPCYTSYQGKLVWDSEVGSYPLDCLVLWFGVNDYVKSFGFVQDKDWKENYLQSLEEKSPSARQFASGVIEELGKHSRLVEVLRSVKYDLCDKERCETPRVTPEDYISNISYIVSSAKERGTETVIIIPKRRSTDKVNFKTHQRYTTSLRKFCDNMGVPYLDLEKELPGERGDSLLQDFVHPTAEGHRIVADELSKIILEQYRKRTPKDTN